MTRSGDDYVRGLRDSRTVLLNGERVADVTTHPAFGAGVRTVAQLYDLAHDPAGQPLKDSRARAFEYSDCFAPALPSHAKSSRLASLSKAKNPMNSSHRHNRPYRSATEPGAPGSRS